MFGIGRRRAKPDEPEPRQPSPAVAEAIARASRCPPPRQLRTADCSCPECGCTHVAVLVAHGSGVVSRCLGCGEWHILPIDEAVDSAPPA